MENKKPVWIRTALAAIVLLAAAGISWHFLSHTPSGCYSKTFAIGSSLCHQIPSHSPVLNGVQFPLCSRCTGLYLGSLIGLVYALFAGRKAGIPKRPYLILLLAIFVIWGIDGVNSLISDFLNRPFLYETTNLTRTISGFGMGLVMATTLATLFNITVWKERENTPILHSPLQVGIYALFAAAINLLITTNNDYLFRLASYLAIFTAVAIITLLYSVFWIILLKKENTFQSLNTLWVFLVAGFATSMLQITLLVTLRNSVL
jgi:uncharacterized membrane protein